MLLGTKRSWAQIGRIHCCLTSRPGMPVPGDKPFVKLEQEEAGSRLRRFEEGMVTGTLSETLRIKAMKTMMARASRGLLGRCAG